MEEPSRHRLLSIRLLCISGFHRASRNTHIKFKRHISTALDEAQRLRRLERPELVAENLRRWLELPPEELAGDADRSDVFLSRFGSSKAQVTRLVEPDRAEESD